jgi:tetratricopeptide (TPR) repeat protein
MTDKSRPVISTVTRKQASPRPLMDRDALLHVLLLTLLSFGLYAVTLSGDFVWDDRALILQNPMVQSPSLVRILSSPLTLFSGPTGYYRPLSILSLAVDNLLYHGQPWGFHLTNVLLHLGCTLLFYLLLRLLWAPLPAFLSSLLFSSLAVHTEAVAFISGRMDLWATFFFLLSLVSYLTLRQRDHRLAGCWVASAFWLLGLLSKEMAVTLPLILWILPKPPGQLSMSKARTPVRKLKSAIPFVLVLLLYLFIRTALIGWRSNPESAVLPLSGRLLALPFVLGRYLQVLALPYNLNARLLIQPLSGIADPRFFVPLAALILLFIGIYSLRRKATFLGFGALWLLLTLLPVLNLIPLEGTLYAERFLYLPSCGFAVLAIALWSALSAKLPKLSKAILWSGVLLLVCLNIAFALPRNFIWHDEQRFFSRLVLDSPDSPLAHLNLGVVYYRRAEYDKALQEYQRALSLNPDYPEAHASLGDVLVKMEDFEAATQEYERYLALKPDAPNRELTLRKIQALRQAARSRAP